MRFPLPPFLVFTLAALAVWRLTHLFVHEAGPWIIFSRLRGLLGAGFFGSLIQCFYCFSLWVAVPFAYVLAEPWSLRFLLWPSLSGAAILLQRLTDHPDATQSAFSVEDTPDIASK